MVSAHSLQDHPEKTKEAILRAASELFCEAGYQGMTIDEVARRANIGKGTVYLYFESKQELALSILDRINGGVQDRLRSILHSHGSPEERLKRMLLSRVLDRFECVKNYRAGLDQMYQCLRPRLMERKKVYVDKEAVSFMEILVEGRTLGVFQCDDPLETAHALITATSALLPYSLSPAELGSRRTVERRAEVLTDLLVKAIQKS